MKHRLTVLAATTTTALLGLSVLAPAQAATGEWQDGYSASDTLYNCITQDYSTGVSANVGWWSPTGTVPKVGESFLLRGYAGLIGLPCNAKGSVVVLPEIMLPEGIEALPGPVTWGINDISDTTPTFGTEPVGVFNGANGGVVLTADVAGEYAFEITRGQVFEFRFPVKATRELKGGATRVPSCPLFNQSRGPCPAAESGDHLQVAFFTEGHSSTQDAVIPYVPLFAAKAGTGTSTPVPGTPGTPIPGAVTSAPGAAASSVRASYRVSATKPGRAVVKVRGAKAPTGTVVVRDLAKAGKVVGRAKLTARARGSVTVRIAKLGKGTHRLVAQYLGSAKVKASSSPVRTLRLR
ncbi:MAG TPA: Ig-like domain-containing protein [Nocardioides sp.]|uniref:Ig-like domain-containing protein n=1 Tax=Nocardioides sp. TaxID=35761 RepID=UPI002ED8115B